MYRQREKAYGRKKVIASHTKESRYDLTRLVDISY